MLKTAQEIILRPLVTEKSTEGVTKENKYTFQVHRKANKIQIKNAVEALFKVKVMKVTTISLRGKMRRFGRAVGKTSDWKKAQVTLKEGDRIQIPGLELFET